MIIHVLFFSCFFFFFFSFADSDDRKKSRELRFQNSQKKSQSNFTPVYPSMVKKKKEKINMNKHKRKLKQT